jgi:AcrR family transcriptional regulator
MAPQQGSEATAARSSRPVGRPTRAPERREQILDAVERCIIEHGLAETTLARVAEIAEMPRSLIHHYMGSRDALLRATAARAIENVQSSVRAGLAELQDRAETMDFDHSLDVFFGPRMQDPRITRLVDELGVVSFRDDLVRELLANMYRTFVSHLEGDFKVAFPHAPADHRRTIAHAIVGLADAASRFQDYGVDAENFRRMRSTAARLVQDLRSKHIEMSEQS